MFQRFLALSAFVFLMFSVASAQEPAAAPALGYEDTYQINAIGNLNLGDSYVNIVNPGFHMTTPATSGYVCANVYTFDFQEEMIACCTCPVSRNGIKTLSARNDLISNTLTPGVPTSIVIKLVYTTPINGDVSAPVCNASTLPAVNALGGNGIVLPAPGFPYIANAYATGMRAWATNLHVGPGSPPTIFGTETKFEDVPLQENERVLLASFCGFIQANGSGFGICKSCRAGYQGATSK